METNSNLSNNILFTPLPPIIDPIPLQTLEIPLQELATETSPIPILNLITLTPNLIEIPKNYTNNNLKPKKSIKKEYYKMKPNIIKKHNLRFIEPYEFEYQVYAKGRWIGKKLIDILNHEFKQFNEYYFLEAIKNGKLKINSYLTNPNYILKRNDFITHKLIRKENPIIDAALEIVFEDDEFLVVNKPSSWPVHVCGGYQFNTLHRILMDEYNYEMLKVLHRLDKHTSGIVIMGKNKKSAENFRKNLHTENVQKTYLCRVKGDFKPEKINVIRSIILVNKSKGIYSDCEYKEENDLKNEYYATDIDHEFQEIKEGGGIYSKGKSKKIFLNLLEKKNPNLDKSGVNIKLELNPEKDAESEDEGKLNFIIQIKKKKIEKFEPKYAETDFEKIFYDEKSNTSVVYAMPKTGRTHQIRIHLRYIGFPIANDPCYGGIVHNALKDFDNPDYLKFQQYVPDIDEYNKEKNKDSTEIKEDKIECREVLSVSEVFCYKIWLHAFNYKFEEYEFKTTRPDWANKEYELNIKF